MTTNDADPSMARSYLRSDTAAAVDDFDDEGHCVGPETIVTAAMVAERIRDAVAVMRSLAAEAITTTTKGGQEAKGSSTAMRDAAHPPRRPRVPLVSDQTVVEYDSPRRSAPGPPPGSTTSSITTTQQRAASTTATTRISSSTAAAHHHGDATKAAPLSHDDGYYGLRRPKVNTVTRVAAPAGSGAIIIMVPRCQWRGAQQQ